MSGASGRVAPGGGRFKLLVVGVGGQGVLTAARFLGEAALLAGRQVVLGQLHGMSQRGGSVQSTVLIGPGSSSFIEPGSADVVLGLEPLEVLRARPEMSGDTVVVVNRDPVVAPALARAGEDYPDVERILAEVRAVAPRTVEVGGGALLGGARERRSLNVLMLGALASVGALPLDCEELWRGIEMRCPPRRLEPSRRAFELGREAVRA